jgi:hypothetical protein
MAKAYTLDLRKKTIELVVTKLKNKPLLLHLFNNLIITKFFILMRLDSILLTNVIPVGGQLKID